MKKLRSFLLTILIIASTVTAYGASYTLTSASYPINVNGEKIAVEPLNLNGTTYLPLKSISDAVGVPIEWNNANKSVEINTVDVEALKEACVMIYGDKENQAYQGSGVYVDYDQILTANHVVSGYSNLRTSDGDTLNIDKANNDVDVATLMASNQVKPVKIGDSDEVKVGDKVILISSPDGKLNTVTYSKIHQSGNPSEFIITGDEISGGSSGGALFNMNGELIGILFGGADKWEFVRPINDIRKAL